MMDHMERLTTVRLLARLADTTAAYCAMAGKPVPELVRSNVSFMMREAEAEALRRGWGVEQVHIRGFPRLPAA